MVRTTFQPISSGTFLSASSQNLLFLDSSLPCQPPAWGHRALKSLIGWSYGTARGSISMPVGLKMGNSALVLSTIHILPLFQLWPKLRTSDSRVRLNSSPSQFCRQRTCQHSSFQPVSLRWLPSCPRWSWRAGSSSFLASVLLLVHFLRFFLSLCIGTLGKWRPWAIRSSKNKL